MNLQRNDLEIHTVCTEDICGQYHHRNINSKTYNIHFDYNCQNEYNFDSYNDQNHGYNLDNQYVTMDDHIEFDKYFQNDTTTCNFNKNEINKNNYENDNCKNNFDNEYERELKNDEFNNDFNENRIDDFVDSPYSESNEDTQSLCHSKIDSNENNEEIMNDNKNNNENDAINPNDNGNRNINNEIVDENLQTNTELNQNIKQLENNISENEDNKLDDNNVNNDKKLKNKEKKRKKEFDKIILSPEEQKAEIDRRRKDKKYVEAEFKCYNCALGFLFKDTYQTHMLRHEEVSAICSFGEIKSNNHVFHRINKFTLKKIRP